MNNLFQLPELFTLSGQKVTSDQPFEDLILGFGSNTCGNGSGNGNSCSHGTGLDQP